MENSSGEVAIQVFGNAATEAGWDYNAYLIAEIKDLIGDFSVAQTKQLVKKLLRECKFTPKIAEIAKAKRDIAPEHTGISEFGKKHPWDLREEKIYSLVDDYCKNFQSAGEYQQAEREGWNGSFDRFLRATANSMAAMIEGYQEPGKKYANWGWDSMAVNYAYRDEYHKLLKQNYHHVRQHGIDVMRAMPGGQIPKWREYHAKQNAA